MAQIGLSVTKTFSVYDQTVTIGFWCPTQILKANSEIFQLSLVMRGYTSKAYFLAHGKKAFYPPATVTLTFNLTQNTWPFVQGSDPWPALWTLIKSLSATTNEDGGEINGGIDWSSATDEFFP